MLEFFVPTDLEAARELKFPVEQLFIVVFKFLFSFVEDIVVFTVGSGCEIWVAGWVGWVEGKGKEGLGFRLSRGGAMGVCGCCG